MSTEVSYLSMSDEELSKVDINDVPEDSVVEPVKEETTEVQEDIKTEPVIEDKEDSGETSDEQEVKEPEDVKVVESVVDAAKEEASTEDSIDYKQVYSKIFAPFKANGKEISVASVDDAISLMQMGANYTKKMSALKPNLKLMKLLENSSLLSEEKISYLIDLDKKSPEAISKLIKDSNLDPMDLDADKASGYKPNTYSVDDREIELDSVLDEIQGTPTYSRTLDIVSTKWDKESKQVIANTPQLLKVINSHVQTGIYDTILKEVESERMFGRLDGLSDIEAYRRVGDAIQSRGGFNQLGHQKETQPKPVTVTPVVAKVEDDKLKDKRRAASSTKPAGSASVAKDFNPLAMSDEEFSKHANSIYL